MRIIVNFLPCFTSILAVLLSCSGCGKPSTAVEPVAKTSANDRSTTSAPITVTDSLGREVTLAGPPKRIVSLAPSNTEILLALGLRDLLVGVTDFDDKSLNVESVGGFAANSISVEKIVSLRPDVVLTAGGIQGPVIDALERSDHAVIAFVDAKNFDEVFRNIRLVGSISTKNEAAEQLIGKMRERVDRVRATVATIPQAERVRVFYQLWEEPLYAAGSNSLIGQLVDLAGGINLFVDLPEQYPQVSAEAVVQRNPQVILAPGRGSEEQARKRIETQPGWSQTAAVKNGKIHFIVEDLISQPGPTSVDGLEAVAHAIYPDRFPALSKAAPHSSSPSTTGLAK